MAAVHERLSKDDPHDVRHVSWNVLWRFAPDWRARERAILALLSQLRPDVLRIAGPLVYGR